MREVTHLQSRVAPGQVAVVDGGPAAASAHVDGFRVVLDPLAEQMRQRTPAANSSGLVMGVGSRVTGVQAGLILAYLSSRVLGQYELFLPPGSGSNGEEPVGRLDAGRAEHRDGRARARRRSERLPPLGVPARGDPPGAVHLGAVAARVRPGSDDGIPAGLRPRPRGHPQPAVGRGRCGGGGARRRQREPHRGYPDAAAKGDPRAAHRSDDPGRGPRRLRDGRRWPAGRAVRRRDQGTVQRPAQDGGPGRAGHPAPPGYRPEMAPVRGRGAFRSRGRRPDRHGTA